MADGHFTAFPVRIMNKYKLSSFFYLDTWPFGDPMVVVQDPAVRNAVNGNDAVLLANER
jgi:hypothetical protein